MSERKAPIVIKRIAAARGHKHGGGWKIAYADFMTALMATFLVLWLLSIATPKTRAGIAEHFRMPLKVALNGGEKSGTSTSVIPGGGPDPMHADGEVNRPEPAELERLREMKKHLEQLIDANPLLKQFRAQLLIDFINDGLRIQIVDSSNRPMFDLSSAAVKPYMRAILQQIGPVLNDLPNKITVSGHTDAARYAQRKSGYSNWELSADRANASRREMIAGGMLEEKTLRVMGVASTMDLNKKNPFDPVNRRISIIVLNHMAQQRIEQENASAAEASIDNSGSAAGQLRAVTPVALPKPAVPGAAAAKP